MKHQTNTNSVLAVIFLLLSIALLLQFTASNTSVKPLTVNASAILRDAPVLDVHTVAASTLPADGQLLVWDIDTTQYPLNAYNEIKSTDIGIEDQNPALSFRGYYGDLSFKMTDTELALELNTPAVPTSGIFASTNGAATTAIDTELGIAKVMMPISVVQGESYEVIVELGDVSNDLIVSLRVGTASPSEIVRFESIHPLYVQQDNVLYTALRGHADAAALCSEVTGSYEVDVAISLDSSPVALEATPEGRSVCGDVLNESSYDAPTSTFTLKQIAASTATAPLPSTLIYAPESTEYAVSSFNKTDDVFDNAFVSGNASQPVHFIQYATADEKGYNTSDEYPVATATFDFATGNVDLSSANVTFDSDKSAYKAVAHNLAAQTDNGTFTLYVPFKTGDTSVGVCPGAASLSEVSESCTDAYQLNDGQSKTSADEDGIPSGATVSASTVTIDGSEYWQIDGLTGSGAFSGTVAGTSTTPGAPSTGFSLDTLSTSQLVLGGVLAIGALAIAQVRDRRTYSNK